MDGEDGDSLFEGMEFVNPISLEDPETEISKTASDGDAAEDPSVGKDATSTKLEPSTSQGERGQLDSNLFSSLQVQDPPAVNGEQPPPPGTTDKGEEYRSEQSGGDGVSVGADSSKAPIVRKKKKSIRVGYAREGETGTGELQASLDELYAAAPKLPSGPPEAEAESSSSCAPDQVPSAADDKSGSGELGKSRQKGDGEKWKGEAKEPGKSKEQEKAKTQEEAIQGTAGASEASAGGLKEESSGLRQVKQASEDAKEDATGSEKLRSRIQGTLRDLKLALERIQGRVREVTVARKTMVQRKREAAQALVKHLEKLEKAEAEVAAACDREDFETADSLSQKAEELQRDADGARVAHFFAEEECNSLLQELQSLTQAEVDAQLAAVAALENIHKEAADLSSTVLQSAEKRAEEELERVQVEEEALEVKKRKVTLERRVLAEQEADLAAKVDSLTGKEREEEQQLLEGKEALGKELEVLLELVREKEAEIKAQDEKISAVKGKIGAVAARFGKVQTEIEQERARVEAVAVEVEEQEKALEQARRDVEGMQTSAKQSGEELVLVIKDAVEQKAEVQQAAEKKRAAAQEGQSWQRRMAELAEEEKTSSKDAQDIQESGAALKAEEQELSAKVSRLQQEAAGIAQRLALANRRLPELEVEKKAAAASRNFKDAARLAAEGKLLANDKAAALEEEKRVGSELKETEQALAMKTEEISAIDVMASDKTRAAALARCCRLRLEAAGLRREMEASAEMEDFEEAECLRDEAEAADKEVEQLCILHHISREEVEKHAEV